MPRKKIKIEKNINDNNYKIQSEGNINIEFSIDTDPGILGSISEMLRFLQNIGKQDFSFSVELDKVSENIPVINLIPVRHDEKPPLVLFIHGFETSKEKVLRYGIHMASNGFYTVLMDLPDHGERLIPNFEEKYSLHSDPFNSWFNRLRLMKKALDEIKIIIDHYCTLDEIDNSRIGVSGISMGGSITLLSAYNDKRIKAIAPFLSILGYDSIKGMENINLLDEEKLRFITSLDPFYVYKSKPEASILLQFGEKDRITERPVLYEFEKNLVSLYANSPENLKFVKHKNVSHDVSLAMINDAQMWFDKFLK